MFHIFTPCKRQKTKGFLTFSGGIEWNIGLKWVNPAVNGVFYAYIKLNVHMNETRGAREGRSGSIFDVGVYITVWF